MKGWTSDSVAAHVKKSRGTRHAKAASGSQGRGEGEKVAKNAKLAAKFKKAGAAAGIRLRPILYVGIDPGTHVGIAVWDAIDKKFVEVSTMTICEALEIVKDLYSKWGEIGGGVLVRIEDARLRTFFGNTGPEKWKGAGSIMRDCSIWEDEMKRLGINYEMVHPKYVKATTAAQFKKLTGWTQRTSIHAREAAYLILGK